MKRHEIKKGAVMYLSTLASEKVQRITIVTEPHKDRYIGVVFNFYSDDDPTHLRAMTLGDLGVEGFAYDDRPCQLAASEAGAIASHKDAMAWLSNLRNKTKHTSEIRRAGRRYGH